MVKLRVKIDVQTCVGVCVCVEGGVGGVPLHVKGL